jgi:hypothetical protein
MLLLYGLLQFNYLVRKMDIIFLHLKKFLLFWMIGRLTFLIILIG